MQHERTEKEKGRILSSPGFLEEESLRFPSSGGEPLPGPTCGMHSLSHTHHTSPRWRRPGCCQSGLLRLATHSAGVLQPSAAAVPPCRGINEGLPAPGIFLLSSLRLGEDVGITLDDEHSTSIWVSSSMDDALTIFRFHCSLFVVHELPAGQNVIPLNPGPSTKQ